MFKLYNGCPNRELQDHMDSQAAAHKRIAELGYRITWFPMESCYYLADGKTYKTIGPEFSSKSSALHWLERQHE